MTEDMTQATSHKDCLVGERESGYWLEHPGNRLARKSMNVCRVDFFSFAEFGCFLYAYVLSLEPCFVEIIYLFIYFTFSFLLSFFFFFFLLLNMIYVYRIGKKKTNINNN